MQSFTFLRRYFSTLRFTPSHEWIQWDPTTKKAKVGITNYAQQQLGEIIFIELPSVGKKLDQKDSAAVVQSVKIAADVYTPIQGSISSVNTALQKNPQLVNDDADKTWIFEVNYTQEPTNLLTEEEYKKTIA